MSYFYELISIFLIADPCYLCIFLKFMERDFIQQCKHVNSNVPIYPSLTSFTLVTISSFSKSVNMFLFCKQVYLYHFQIPLISILRWYLSVSVCFTSLGMIISRSIHVAANGIIAFFLQISNILLFICINITSSFSILLSMDFQFASINVICYYKFPDGSVVKNPPANAGDTALILGVGRSPLEREMVTHSSVLACEIPWTEEPGGLESIELQKSQTQLCD